MRAPGAFLRQVEVVVEVDHVVRAAVHAHAAAGALVRVDDHQAVFTLVERALDGAGRDAGRLVAVLAEQREIVHLHLRHGPADVLDQMHPELPGVGLRLGDRRPVVADVLVLADELARVAADTLVDVDDEYLHLCLTFPRPTRRSAGRRRDRTCGRRHPGSPCATPPTLRS